MRILTILIVLAHVIFSFDISSAEGISIGEVRINGKKYGGVALPNGSYGSIHQITKINDLREGMQVTTREGDRYVDEGDSVYIFETEEPIIDLPVVAPRNRGFASFKANELMQNAE